MSKKIEKTTYAEAAEQLRCAVAFAQTRQQFGKALQDLRKAMTGRGVRFLVGGGGVFNAKTTVNDREIGKYAFTEQQLRAYLHNCDAEDDLIVFCLQHHQRVEDLAAAQPSVDTSPQDTNSETDQQHCATSEQSAALVADTPLRQQDIPRVSSKTRLVVCAVAVNVWSSAMESGWKKPVVYRNLALAIAYYAAGLLLLKAGIVKLLAIAGINSPPHIEVMIAKKIGTIISIALFNTPVMLALGVAAAITIVHKDYKYYKAYEKAAYGDDEGGENHDDPGPTGGWGPGPDPDGPTGPRGPMNRLTREWKRFRAVQLIARGWDPHDAKVATGLGSRGLGNR